MSRCTSMHCICIAAYRNAGLVLPRSLTTTGFAHALAGNVGLGKGVQKPAGACMWQAMNLPDLSPYVRLGLLLIRAWARLLPVAAHHVDALVVMRDRLQQVPQLLRRLGQRHVHDALQRVLAIFERSLPCTMPINHGQESVF